MTDFPERALWQSVILAALHDACNPNPRGVESRRAKDTAHDWFAMAGKDFQRICEWAGFNPDFIRDAYLSGRIQMINLYSVHKLRQFKYSPAVGDCGPAQPGNTAVNPPQGSDRPCGVEARQ